MAKSNMGVAILGFGVLVAGIWLIAKLTSFLDKKEYLIYSSIWSILSVILIIVGIALVYWELKRSIKEEITIEFWNGVYKMGFSLIVVGGILLGVGLISYLLIYTQVIENGASLMKLLNAGAIVGGGFIVVGVLIAFFANNKKIEDLDKNDTGTEKNEKVAKKIEDKIKKASDESSRASDNLKVIGSEKPSDENR